MTIKELFKQAVEQNLLDLQILIMFLVYEKQVLTMDDDTKELDLYFLEKHHKRMRKLLLEYKAKLKMKEKPCAWKVYTNENEILYVYTENELQARTFAISMKYEPLRVAYVPEEELMTVNDINITIGELTQGKQVPYLIGIYELGKYKMEGI